MQRWSKILLSLLATSSLFAACKKPTYSSDEPLPTSYHPSIIMSSENQVVYAIDPETGTKNWEVALPTPFSTGSSIPPLTGVPLFKPSPLLYNGMVYVATGTWNSNRSAPNDTLYKINARTGKVVKKIVIAGVTTPYLISGSPVADANLIYVPTSTGTLYAIDTGTSIVKWRFTAFEPGASIVATPTVANGAVYIATTTGHVYSIDKTIGPDGSGNPKWDYPGAGVPTRASFISSPAVDTHYLFVGSATDSNMYCIYVNPPTSSIVPTPGVARWTYKTKGGINSSPVAYQGTCIFGCNDFHLYCLDTFIYPLPPINQFVPQARWIDSAHSEIYSSPFVSGNTVYFASKDYRLYCANIINGGIKWSFATNGALYSSPLVYRDKVYIASYDKVLYAVDTALGTIKWQYPIGGQMSSSPVIDDLSGRSFNTAITGDGFLLR